ncbi:MAG TPA: hypothetical protein VGN57_09130 [Pirellulaceae bacterium]|jgi:hypothetical protein|nr:hypothetical protein [Pirellulaceae bacterium]
MDGSENPYVAPQFHAAEVVRVVPTTEVDRARKIGNTAFHLGLIFLGAAIVWLAAWLTSYR